MHKENRLIYSPEQLKWSVTGDIGTITQSGSFKAANKAGKGQVNCETGYENDKHSDRIVGRASAFTDISADYAYYTEIKFLKELGYIKGDLDGKFNPGNTLSREHAAVILSRVFDCGYVKSRNTEIYRRSY